MTERTEFLEDDELPVERFVISFNLATATRVVRPAEDQLDAVFFGFCFEQFRNELFPVIEINLAWNPAGTKSPLEGIDR